MSLFGGCHDVLSGSLLLPIARCVYGWQLIWASPPGGCSLLMGTASFREQPTSRVWAMSWFRTPVQSNGLSPAVSSTTSCLFHSPRAVTLGQFQSTSCRHISILQPTSQRLYQSLHPWPTHTVCLDFLNFIIYPVLSFSLVLYTNFGPTPHHCLPRKYLFMIWFVSACVFFPGVFI